MPATSWALVCQGENLTGVSRIVYLETDQRYRSMVYEQWDLPMQQYGAQINSAQVYPALDGTGTACLIILHSWYGNTITLSGQIAQIHRVQDIGGVNIKTVNPKVLDPGHGVNSVITINTQRPNRFYIARNFQAIVNAMWPQIQNQAVSADPNMSVYAGPRVAWVWHEQLVKYLLPERPYACLDVVFNYSPSGIGGSFLSDYKISARIFFNFWAQNGVVAASADRYEANVSPGLIRSYVKEIANLSLQLAMWEINVNVLPQALDVINQLIQNQNRVATDVFLLPGNQVATSGFMNFGNTNLAIDAKADATLVVELM